MSIEFGLPQDEPTPIMVDNSNVLVIVNNLVSTDKTRHIERREMVVREREAQGTSKVTKVDTSDNLADMFTKILARDPFELLRALTMQLTYAHGHHICASYCS